MKLDATQNAVLEFNQSRHATILGAAGTGKTHTIVELIARESQSVPAGQTEQRRSVVLVHNRRAGMKLRRNIESRIDTPLQGSAVRTPTSLAFWIVAKFAAERGEAVPRLMTGPMQDDAIAEALDESQPSLFGKELRESQTFRAELRNLWRLCDDYDLRFDELEKFGRYHRGDPKFGELPDMWVAAAKVLTRTISRLHVEGLYTASGVLRAARVLIAQVEDRELVFMPSRIIVDDAQDLTEGALGLVAECAARGIAVWSFGDPDLATASFQGERTEFVTSVTRSMSRKLGRKIAADEQQCVLQTVHRGEPHLRELARIISSAIGTASAGQQRAACTATQQSTDGYVESVILRDRSELVGAISHRLRETRLGIDTAPPTPWGEMAVVCRSRAEAELLSRELTFKEIPTRLVGGGMILREHRIVRDLVTLIDAVLSDHTLSIEELSAYLTGPLGGIDSVEMRRMRAAILLQERKAAHHVKRESRRSNEVMSAYLNNPSDTPLIDSASGRRLHRFVKNFHYAKHISARGATAREIAWVFWDGAKIADHLQESALHAPKQAVKAEASLILDAVLALMFVLERAEDSAANTRQLLTEILTSDVPEDTLAATGVDDAVVISTPQGVIGREYGLVILAELQDGKWPNLRPRGSLLGLTALERSLRGEEVLTTERIDTLHDELRLLLHSVTRSTGRLFAAAVDNAEIMKSSFWQYFAAYAVEQVPTSGLTLRGMVAALRRAVEANPEDRTSAHQLAVLARHEVPGANPGDWYGIREATTTQPLVDLADPHAYVRVSPSSMSRTETCPLASALDKLGGPDIVTLSSGLGTLLHAAFEQLADGDSNPAAIQRLIQEHWEKLPFAAEWEAERQERITEQMAAAITDYVDKQTADTWHTIGKEIGFAFEIGRAKVSGKVDRLEARTTGDTLSIRVVDLKSGKTALSAADTQTDAQLLAYQYALETGNLATDVLMSSEGPHIDGAQLLYVHPTHATAKSKYRLREQQPMDITTKAEFEDRVTQVAESMVGPTFTAQVEHHCTDDQGGITNCALHIIPAVSFE